MKRHRLRAFLHKRAAQAIELAENVVPGDRADEMIDQHYGAADAYMDVLCSVHGREEYVNLPELVEILEDRLEYTVALRDDLMGAHWTGPEVDRLTGAADAYADVLDFIYADDE